MSNLIATNRQMLPMAGTITYAPCVNYQP